MPGEIRIVVVDAAPLITLAAARSLDYLLYPALPVVIPDAVFHEATASAGKLGAQEIIDWYRAHADAVRVEPTEVFQVEILASEATGRRLSRDVGERAAVEVVRHADLLREGEAALLLSDDRDARRLVVVDPARIVLLTTWDYLRLLEEVQRIQSADAVMDAVRAAGRNPPARGLFANHPPEVRDAVREILRQARHEPPDR
jgi:predicted nucleic acid-binding protein